VTGTDERVGDGPLQQTLPESFEEFLKQRSRRFMKYAQSRMRNREDAEEAVSKAALLLHRKWDRITRHEKREAFAFHVLERVIIDYWRQQSRLDRVWDAALLLQRTAPVHYASDGIDQFGRLAEHDGLDQALDALETRSPRQAKCVRLRHMVGLSHDEIAVLLDISSTRAKNETWQGLRFLRDRLDPPMESGEGSAAS